MVSFSDIMSIEIKEQEVKKNIVHVLSTGEYNAPYTKDLEEYIQSDIQSFIQCFNPSENEDVIIRPATMLYDKDGCFDVRKAIAYAKERQIKDKNWFYSELPAFALGATAQRLDGQKQDYTFFYNMYHEPFNALERFYHELSHLVEVKKGYKKLPKDIHDEKEDTIESSRSEIYANAMANTILIAKALQTQNLHVIEKVKKDVLFYSSYMSNGLINSGLGVAYCDWGATSRIIPDLEKNGISKLFQKNGQIDWNATHDYVVKKIEEMEYTPQMYLDAKEKIHPKLKDLKLSGATLPEILDAAKLMTDKNVVLNDFIEAQTYYQSVNSNQKKLEMLYGALYYPLNRKKNLCLECYNNLPDINRYRKIYELSQRKHPFSNFAQKTKSIMQFVILFFNREK